VSFQKGQLSPDGRVVGQNSGLEQQFRIPKTSPIFRRLGFTTRLELERDPPFLDGH
jgi:hypothetical protein